MCFWSICDVLWMFIAGRCWSLYGSPKAYRMYLFPLLLGVTRPCTVCFSWLTTRVLPMLCNIAIYFSYVKML